MTITCMPSQVMRDGRDLNQQGHAARQEQASSSSPETFQDGLASALSPARHISDEPSVPRMIPIAIGLIVVISLIGFVADGLWFTRGLRFSQMDSMHVIAAPVTNVKNKSEHHGASERQVGDHRQ